jgi:hypothetical protein
MVALLLNQIDRLILVAEAGRLPNETELLQLREHQALWRADLERLRRRLSSATIEPPSRIQ